jgi:hypothetical protein
MNLRNRIVGTGNVKPDTVQAHPKNWRSHSVDQESAIEGLLEEVGWVSNVIVNRKTGHLLDGHLRVDLAKKRGEKTVPVVYVELSAKEEKDVTTLLDQATTRRLRRLPAVSRIPPDKRPAGPSWGAKCGSGTLTRGTTRVGRRSSWARDWLNATHLHVQINATVYPFCCALAAGLKWAVMPPSATFR